MNLNLKKAIAVYFLIVAIIFIILYNSNNLNTFKKGTSITSTEKTSKQSKPILNRNKSKIDQNQEIIEVKEAKFGNVLEPKGTKERLETIVEVSEPEFNECFGNDQAKQEQAVVVVNDDDDADDETKSIKSSNSDGEDIDEYSDDHDIIDTLVLLTENESNNKPSLIDITDKLPLDETINQPYIEQFYELILEELPQFETTLESNSDISALKIDTIVSAIDESITEYFLQTKLKNNNETFAATDAVIISELCEETIHELISKPEREHKFQGSHILTDILNYETINQLYEETETETENVIFSVGNQESVQSFPVAPLETFQEIANHIVTVEPEIFHADDIQVIAESDSDLLPGSFNDTIPVLLFNENELVVTETEQEETVSNPELTGEAATDQEDAVETLTAQDIAVEILSDPEVALQTLTEQEIAGETETVAEQENIRETPTGPIIAVGVVTDSEIVVETENNPEIAVETLTEQEVVSHTIIPIDNLVSVENIPLNEVEPVPVPAQIIEAISVPETRIEAPIIINPQDLFNYIESGDLESFRSSLPFIENIHTIWDREGYNLLHRAASAIEIHFINLIIEKSSLILAEKTRDGKGFNSIHLIVEKSQGLNLNVIENCINKLIENGQNVNASSDESFTCTPLYLAIKQKNIKLAEFLISKGASVNTDHDGFPILHIAIAEGELKMVKLLLTRGADVKAVNKMNRMALHEAAHLKKAEIVYNLLLTEGVDINDRTPLLPPGTSIPKLKRQKEKRSKRPKLYGATALFYAIINGHYETVCVLKFFGGANLNIKDEYRKKIKYYDDCGIYGDTTNSRPKYMRKSK